MSKDIDIEISEKHLKQIVDGFVINNLSIESQELYFSIEDGFTEALGKAVLNDELIRIIKIGMNFDKSVKTQNEDN